ncbi:uncharacterized protein LOC128213723 [Mya arenaria]|uniref:uncharacterized protein LOC128213723 n=1 Tax=Mya arenaria TaxID=6604 RepID=UPI0022E77029|nr:uncharacterized protein LOC128213723 [Mya arenaria]
MNIWLGWQLCWSCVLAGLLATPVLSSLLGPPRDNRIHHVIRGLVAHLDRCDGQFLCERMGVGRNRKGLARCVPLDKVRDGHCDCPTCCDEVFNTPGKLCKQSEFRCADGSCVPLNRMCDGVHDCPGYDELKCGGVKECPRKGFRCVSSHQCVPASRVCDGNQDCTCGEDEHSCGCGHMGKSFLIAFTRCPCPEAIPVLYITAAQTTTVTITSARFTPITLGVSRSTRVNLLQNVFPIAPVIDVVSDSTVRITADEPISVVAVVTCEDTSTLMLQEVEGTLIVPEDCASTKYLVEAVSSKSSTNSDTEGQVVIAAYEDNTLVEVTQPNGNKTSTTLQKFQMFYVEGSNLSGSIIKGNKKIAVYSGSQVVRIPLDTSQVSKGVIFEALPFSWTGVCDRGLAPAASAVLPHPCRHQRNSGFSLGPRRERDREIYNGNE